MEFNEVINNILYIALTAIVPIVVPYVVQLLKAKIEECHIIKNATQNEHLENLVNTALSDVMDAVVYVNQIYVDTLKAKGEFNKEAQDEAFNRAYVEAMNMISQSSKKAIEETYGSFDKWLKLKIEASVNAAKK